MVMPSGATVEQVDDDTVFFQGAVSNSSCASLVKQLWKMQSEHIQKCKDEVDLALNRSPLARSAENVAELVVVFSRFLKANTVEDATEGNESRVGTRTSGSELKVEEWNTKMAEETNPIHIHIMSPGGSLQGCFAVIDEMIEMQERDPLNYEGFSIPYRKLHTHTFGASASAAAMIALAGRNRSVGTRDSLLIHQLSAGTYGTLETMKNSMRNFDMYTNSAYEYILERTGIHEYAYWYGEDKIVYVRLCPCNGDRKHDIFTPTVFLEKKTGVDATNQEVEYRDGMLIPKDYVVKASGFPEDLENHVNKGHDSNNSKLRPVIYDASSKEMMKKGEKMESNVSYKRLFKKNLDLMNTWRNIMQYRMEQKHGCKTIEDFYPTFKRFMEADVFLTSSECRMMGISTEETWSVDPSWDASSDSIVTQSEATGAS